MKGHLIHIGAPKTGSTFLQEWFRQHPQLHYAPGGLAGFYNVYQISQLAAKQIDSFQYFVTSDEALSMPSAHAGTIPTGHTKDSTQLTPQLRSQFNVCQILRTLYPNSKILYLTRGFKGLISSGYSQYVREGGAMSLPQLMKNTLLASQKPTVEEEDGGGLDYTFIIKNYQEAFGSENVLVLPFELLRDDKQKFFAQFEQWLDIPPFEGSIPRINESLSPTEMYWYPRISGIVAKVSRKLGKKTFAKINTWYVKKVFNNKFHRIIKLLDRLKPGRALTEADMPPEVLEYFRRNNAIRCAAILKDNPLYAPYHKEYLLA